MTVDELNQQLNDLKIAPKALAERCGVTTATTWNWTTGRVRVPGYVETLLLLTRSNRHLLRQVIGNVT